MEDQTNDLKGIWLGSDVDHCGILTAIVQVAIPDGNGLVGLQTEILACTGQQLIPDPLTNVMEEPAVELPLLDGSGISLK